MAYKNSGQKLMKLYGIIGWNEEKMHREREGDINMLSPFLSVSVFAVFFFVLGVACSVFSQRFSSFFLENDSQLKIFLSIIFIFEFFFADKLQIFDVKIMPNFL